jgi:bifunctional DNA-binding transcriptional regulator/antitoxin component of YhaV-PrlF toxin-antitoxin module
MKDNLPFKIYGTTSVGERGQMVVPVNARKDLKIAKGDQYLVVSHGPKKDVLALIPMKKMDNFVQGFRNYADQVEKEIKRLKK